MFYKRGSPPDPDNYTVQIAGMGIVIIIVMTSTCARLTVS